MAKRNQPGKMILDQMGRKIMVMLFLLVTGIAVSAQQKKRADEPLSLKQKSLVPIAGVTASGKLANLKVALNEGLDAGLTINEIKEVLVQLYAYAGFRRSLNAISTFQNALNERKHQGIKDIDGREPSKENFNKGKFAYGKDVQTKLTGSTATGAAQTFLPAIDTMLKEHLFADIFSRDNLDYQSREIVTISALASLGGAEAQLRGYLNVGRNVGFTEQQLRSIAATLHRKVGQKEGTLTTSIIDTMFGNQAAPASAAKEDLFSKGQKVSNGNFTGDVWVNMLLTPDLVYDISIGSVTFAPGARSNWHIHPAGQILLITEGLGYYQEKGSPKQVLRQGDVVKCSAKVAHWHGASVDQSMTHIALSTDVNAGKVEWLEKVNEEEYGAEPGS